MSTPGPTVKVCVIGAGFSGLSVAYHLLKHNRKAQLEGSHSRPTFEIQILEARGRIGGRVFPCNLSVDDGEPILVDMGAQWIHEAGPDNPMVQLLEELDIPLLYATKEEQRERNAYYHGSNETTNGTSNDNNDTQKRVPSGTYAPDGTKIPDEIFQAARQFYSKSKNNFKRDKINVYTSFQDLLAEAYSKVSANADRTDAEEGYATAQSEVDSESSSSSEEEDDDEDKENEGETMGDETTEDGDDSEDSSEESDSDSETDEAITSNPLFDQTVNYLVHSTECYEGGRLHEVSVSMAELYQEYDGSDEIPVGGFNAVLRKLHDYLKRNNDNCTLYFNCPVQDIYYESDSANTNLDYSAVSDSSNNEGGSTKGVRIEYTNDTTTETAILEADCCVCTVPLGVLQRDIGFHPPLPLAQEQSIDMIGMGVLDKIMMLFDTKFWDDDWFAGIAPEDPTLIQTFSDCSEDYGGKPVLASLLGGNVARRFDDEDEGLTDEEVMAEVMAALRTLFGEDAVPDPVSFKISRWLIDPYAYGAYSFAKVGSTPEDYDRVAKPAGKNLFFAGEHTSKFHHSCVHGAWETGQREAHRLILTATSLSGSGKPKSFSDSGTFQHFIV